MGKYYWSADGALEVAETKEIILDDMDALEMRPYGDLLIETAFNVGLTEKHVARAIKLLNGDL